MNEKKNEEIGQQLDALAAAYDAAWRCAYVLDPPEPWAKARMDWIRAAMQRLVKGES